jgi:hypothetical protein
MNRVTKIQQKKLYSRVFAKSYLDKLKDNTIGHLNERGFFKNSNDNQYYKTLLEHIYDNSSTLVESDYLILNKLNQTLECEFVDKMQNLHKESLLKERNRKAEEARLKKEEEEVILLLTFRER